ncbi:hypothetical protein AgCh_028138 [Apium graveolens]
MADGTHWPGTWLTPLVEHTKGDHAGIIQVMLKPSTDEPLHGTIDEIGTLVSTDIDIHLPILAAAALCLYLLITQLSDSLTVNFKGLMALWVIKHNSEPLGDGITDDTTAFKSAWKAVCAVELAVFYFFRLHIHDHFNCLLRSM